MKKILLGLSLIFAFANLATAQKLSFDVDTAVTTSTAENGKNDFFAKANFTNHSYDNDTFIWVRSNVTKPAPWTSAVCDVMICHDTIVDSAWFLLEKGSTGLFSFHFYSNNGDAGKASMDVMVYNKGDRGNGTKIVARYEAFATSTKEIQKKAISIYPNPTKDKLNIELPANTKIGTSIYVINVLGQNVKTIPFKGNGSYDVSNLDKGVYFLKVKLGSKDVIKKFQIVE